MSPDQAMEMLRRANPVPAPDRDEETSRARRHEVWDAICRERAAQPRRGRPARRARRTRRAVALAPLAPVAAAGIAGGAMGVERLRGPAAAPPPGLGIDREAAVFLGALDGVSHFRAESLTGGPTCLAHTVPGTDHQAGYERAEVSGRLVPVEDGFLLTLVDRNPGIAIRVFGPGAVRAARDLEGPPRGSYRPEGPLGPSYEMLTTPTPARL